MIVKEILMVVTSLFSKSIRIAIVTGAAAIALCAAQDVSAADNGRKTIRGVMSAGGTASGFTSVTDDNGRGLTVPNMSSAAQKIQEVCGINAMCEVVYSVDKKDRVKVHSVKSID